MMARITRAVAICEACRLRIASMSPAKACSMDFPCVVVGAVVQPAYHLGESAHFRAGTAATSLEQAA